MILFMCLIIAWKKLLISACWQKLQEFTMEFVISLSYLHLKPLDAA